MTRLVLRIAVLMTIGLPMVVMLPESAKAQSWNDLEQMLEGRELIMRPTIEPRRKMYIAGANTETYVLYRGDRLFPLRASETVRITDANSKDDHIELKIRSERLGEGRVDFYGIAPSSEDFEKWLDEVFEIATPESDFLRYVGNTKSHTLHLRGANHLPSESERQMFMSSEDGIANGFHLCGVCFMPTPDVSGYETERALSLFSLQQVRSTYYPMVDEMQRERVERLGAEVLTGWPVPLKGYRYRFQLVDADDPNAFAVPTGYIFVTRGLLESLETDDELRAILAHEIAHVESRHSYRQWRNAQTASAIIGVLGALASGTDNRVDDIATVMSAFTANIFMAGFGRDREREADLYASLYMTNNGIGDGPLQSAFMKLQFAHDAIDPFGSGAGGIFASHPDIDERVERASTTITRGFDNKVVFNGMSNDDELVATLRFDAQRLYRRELEVVATLSTTAELGKEDNVNTIEVTVSDQRLILKERTAEKVFPSDEVAAVFGADDAGHLIEGPIKAVRLKLRNVDRWEPAVPVQ